jgi:endo-1,4-beta-D-glucanase Y
MQPCANDIFLKPDLMAAARLWGDQASGGQGAALDPLKNLLKEVLKNLQNFL